MPQGRHERNRPCSQRGSNAATPFEHAPGTRGTCHRRNHVVLFVMNAPSISSNVVSNLASNGVVALMSLLFVPVYIHVLGIEAYGLIGFFASIQVVFALLDLGLGADANRQLAKVSVDRQAKDTARQVRRTLEGLHWLSAVVRGLAMPV